jgi:hypothetical protein
MLLRHWNLAAVSMLFCFGRERRLAITAAVDGIVGLAAMLALVPWLGLHGAAVGAVIGTAGVSLPGNLRALAREQGVSAGAVIGPLRPLFSRIVLTAVVTLLATAWWPVQRPLDAALVGSIVALLYGALMLPMLLKPPLGSLLAPRLQPWQTLGC